MEHTLDDPDSQPGAAFGGVAGVGDVNGDSVPDVAVGAPNHNVGGNGGQGQVFVFSGADGTLLYALDDPSPQANARFGISYGVISIGDLNGDSAPEIAAGAYWQTVAGSWRQGQFFVFSGADGALLYALSHPNPQTDAHFGYSAAVMGDVDGDGALDMAVSAHTQNVGGNTRQGQVYVVSGMDGSLLYTVDHPSPQAHSGFGKTLGAVGDVDADSLPDLVVGADLQTVGGNWRQGQAYVFSGADGSFLYTLDNRFHSRAPDSAGYLEV